ncbi:class C beta-lactamase-related serine hydrolase [Mucilaginibacter limnophilus]|uniref:Class C beta-lactamase-related serine hydrolase n=1 Tax=Mucilaginibacter limnophilus TaxID=1932778 RepID=A0A3S2Y0Y7_9SPHI|nr:serine hydrolase [Mucilaginibacter limnophilus]RVU00918.1 class C beta-lactamase-related serine hydrolase [Mucilaginibacter limnophilus]
MTYRKLTLLLVLILAFTIVQAQNKTGSILFYTDEVKLTEKPVAGLHKMDLTNKSNLFIKVSLAKPLTAYLSELAPHLDKDSLSKVGNYQFNFFVDDKLIYHTELIPGAPRPIQQQKDTVWTKPLIDNQHEGAWWSQSAWNRFIYNGGDSALTDGPHTLRIEFRPYVKTPKLITGNIIAEGTLELLVKRKPEINLANTKLSPVKPYNDLAVSKEKFNIDTIKKLRAYIEANVFRHITSVVALKNGKILFEEYFNGATRDSLHDVRSVGKTFASALTGVALRDGYVKSVMQTLGEFYDLKAYNNYSAAKNKVTLKELLTMSSRFNGDDDDATSPGNEENMYPTDDWAKFTLDLPMDTINYKGQWHYFTSGVMLLGSTLDKVVPDGLDKYADKKLFKPLNITKYQWVYTPQHVPSTAGGIRMNALDFAKFGQLYANKGSWNGTQILPEGWVSESLSHQLPITGRKSEYYGYLFWNKTYRANNKDYEAYYCSGNGGNKIFVFNDLVVVITATAYGTGYAHKQADTMIENFILPAVFGK